MAGIDYDYLFKITLRGERHVGKSNLLSRFARNEYDPNSRTTIGVEFSTRMTHVGGKVVKAQIWDTAGQEHYRAINVAYYRASAAVILVYDISKHNTFVKITRWLQEARVHAPADTILALVGNKSDLEHLREVPTEGAELFAAENGITIFMETSAMNASSVDALFQSVVTARCQTLHQRPPELPEPEQLLKTITSNPPQVLDGPVGSVPLANLPTHTSHPTSNTNTITTSTPSVLAGHQSQGFPLKIAILGNSSVGKSNLLSRFTHPEHNAESKPTTGIEFATILVDVDGKTAKLQIWDTTGEARFRTFISPLYPEANGFILVYDICNRDSYTSLAQWLAGIRDRARSDAFIMLVGNKSDLENRRVVATQEAQEFATKNNMLFAETSAVNGSNVGTAFRSLSQKIYQTVSASTASRTG